MSTKLPFLAIDGVLSDYSLPIASTSKETEMPDDTTVEVLRADLVKLGEFLSDKISRGDLLKVMMLVHGDDSDEDNDAPRIRSAQRASIADPSAAMDAQLRARQSQRYGAAVSGFDKRYPEAARVRVL